MGIRTKNFPENFLEDYEAEVAPKLRNIDLLLKTLEGDITIKKVCEVLVLDETELKRIMKENKIEKIDKNNFFLIMKKGSSRICRLFKREIDCGSPYFYSKQDISYIYELDINDVTKACDFLELEEITSYSLPLLFAQIPVVIS